MAHRSGMGVARGQAGRATCDQEPLSSHVMASAVGPLRQKLSNLVSISQLHDRSLSTQQQWGWRTKSRVAFHVKPEALSIWKHPAHKEYSEQIAVGLGAQ